MNREYLHKLNNDPAWRSVYETALARNEKLFGSDNIDAYIHAVEAADLAADPEKIAALKAAEAEKAQADYIDRLVADALSQPASPVVTEAAPDRHEHARAGWAKAFGKKVGSGPETAEKLAETTEKEPVEPAPASSGWAKAFGTGGGHG